MKEVESEKKNLGSERKVWIGKVRWVVTLMDFWLERINK